MLELQSWLPKAQELVPDIGQRSITEHDCGPGKKLIVENKAEGFSAWCYRCSDKGWFSHPQPSLQERIARLRKVHEAEQNAEATAAPPLPGVEDPSLWPLHARVWLYKAGFHNDSIRNTLGAYYHERLDRVVLPVISGGVCVYWQARGFDPERPKYLNPPIDKPLAYYGEGDSLVLTEDILSAARVGQVTQGCAILGTSLDDRAARAISNSCRRALLWFDDDHAGRKARASVRRTLGQLGVETTIIRSSLDPKYYSTKQIEEFIQSA